MKFDPMRRIRERGAMTLPRWLKRAPQQRQQQQVRLDTDIDRLETAAIAALYRSLPRSSRFGDSRRKMIAQARRQARTPQDRAFRRAFRGITTQQTATKLARVGARASLGRTDS